MNSEEKLYKVEKLLKLHMRYKSLGNGYLEEIQQVIHQKN